MLYYLLSIILVVIDQAVKYWTRATLALGERMEFLPGLLDLTYVQNTGAAFSSFAGMRGLLTFVSLAASVAIAVIMWKGTLFPGRLGKLSLALVLAGAVGNLIDRALFGFVTDMFRTTFMTFPVFNLADICIVVGSALLAVSVLFFYKEEPHDTP